jgi:hypothetical protein
MKRLAFILATLTLVLAGTAGASARRVPRLTPAAATAMLSKGTFINGPEVAALRGWIYEIERDSIDTYGLMPEALPRLKATLVVALRGHTVKPGSMSCVHYRGLPPVHGRYNGFRCALVLNPLDVAGYGPWPHPSVGAGFMNVLLGRNKCPYPGMVGKVPLGRFECFSTPRYGYTWTTVFPH